MGILLLTVFCVVYQKVNVICCRQPLGGWRPAPRSLRGTGKGGIWREKPPDAESARLPRVLGGVGAADSKVWAKARTCPVHAVLGAFCKTVLNLNLIPLLIIAIDGDD